MKFKIRCKGCGKTSTLEAGTLDQVVFYYSQIHVNECEKWLAKFQEIMKEADKKFRDEMVEITVVEE